MQLDNHIDSHIDGQMAESHQLQREELLALKDEFDDLVHREPPPDMEAVFDEAMRRRFGMMIYRLSVAERRREMRNQTTDSRLG